MFELLLARLMAKANQGTGPLPPPPSPNNWEGSTTLCAAQDNTGIYMAGGMTTSGGWNELVLRYNINSRTYTPLPNLPSNITAKNYLQLWQFDNKLYVSRTNTWAVLNLTTQVWSTIATPSNIANCPSYAGRTFVYKDRLLIFGLTPGPGYKSVLAEYLPGSNSIVLLATLPSSKITTYHRATISDDKLYVAEEGIMYEYDIVKNLWAPNKTYPGNYLTANMVSYDKIVYLMGTGDAFVGVTTYDTLTGVYGSAPNMVTKEPGSNRIVAVDDLAYILSNGTFSQYKLGV